MNNTHSPIQTPENERWWAALSYIFSPVLPLILMFIFDLDAYPYLKTHLYQAFFMGILYLICLPVVLPATLCIGGLFWLFMPFWALKAFNGQAVTIPWVTEWVHKKGWV